MSSGARRFLGLASVAGLACAPAAAADRQEKVIVYDAKTGDLGPWLRTPRPSPSPVPPQVRDESGFYDASDAVTIEVQNGRCDDAFKVEVVEHRVGEVQAEVRGLEEAEGLLQGIVGAPPAKGVAAADELALPEVGALVDRLGDAEGAFTLLQELKEDLKRLELALGLQDRAEQEYQQRLAQVSGRLAELKTRSQTLRDRVTGPERPHICEKVEPLAKGYVRLVDDVRVVRALVADRIGTLPDSIVVALDVLVRRIRAYQDKLTRTNRAAELAQEILAKVSPKCEEKSRHLPIAALLSRQKRLKAAFGDVVSEDALRQVVIEYARFNTADCMLLEQTLGELRRETAKVADGEKETRLAVQARSLEARAEKLSLTVRNNRTNFEARADEVDASVRSTRAALDTLYEDARTTRVVVPVGSWTTNQILVVKVLAKRPTQRASAADAPALAGPPAPGATPLPEEFVELASRRFDVHKTYRWTLAGAVVRNTEEEPTFAVRSVPRRGPDREELTDDEGNVLTDKVATQVGSERPLDYAILLHYYFQKQDVFPGAKRARPTLGLTGGISIQDPEDDQYLGLFWQPTDGIQLTGGINFARRTQLQEGVVADETVLDPATTEPPTIKQRQVGAFLGIALDLRIFKRIFGAGS